jgi:flagellar brake protein
MSSGHAVQDVEDKADEPPAQSIHSASEIASLLSQARDQDAPVVLRSSRGQSATCSLWAADEKAGRLHFGIDERDPALPALLEDGQALASTSLAGIRIDFEVDSLVLVRGAQSCSLQTAFPRNLYRLQRRESYRVRIAQRSGPAIRIRSPQRPSEPLALRVQDISIGGCSLQWPLDLPPIDPGTWLKAAQVDLGPGERFGADLLVHSGLPSTAVSGHRLGCAWKNMDGLAQRILQRYVDEAQRRWRSPAL